MGKKDQYHTNIWHAIVAMYYRIMKQFPFVKTRYWIMDTFSASFMGDNYIDLIYCEPFVDKNQRHVEDRHLLTPNSWKKFHVSVAPLLQVGNLRIYYHGALMKCSSLKWVAVCWIK